MWHFLNCHGEWAFIAVMAAHLPLLGLWVRAHLTGFGKEEKGP